jgi:arsenate reductase (thioredoxin)
MMQEADFVYTMGCGVSDVCPAILFKQAVDWNLEDPKGQPIEKVRQIRDQIEKNVTQLISNI